MFFWRVRSLRKVQEVRVWLRTFVDVERFTLGFLSHDGLLRAAGKLLQQAALEVLLRHLGDQQLQQQIQDAEDQMSEGTEAALACEDK